MSPCLRLLICSSPADRGFVDELARHLSVLERSGVIEILAEDRLPPGEDLRLHARRTLERADVAILLLSADFLASSRIQEIDLPILLERSGCAGIWLFPLQVRSCSWEMHPDLSRFRHLLSERPVLATLRGDARDRAYAEIADTIASRIVRHPQQDGSRAPNGFERSPAGRTRPAALTAVQEAGAGPPEHRSATSALSVVLRLTIALLIISTLTFLMLSRASCGRSAPSGMEAAATQGRTVATHLVHDLDSGWHAA